MDGQIPLFVYGTLMRGEARHDLLAGAAEEIQDAVLAGGVLHDLGAFPMLRPGAGAVKGEIVWLRSGAYETTLATLDQAEGVTRGLFHRERRSVLLTGCGPVVEAWVYVGDAAIAEQFPLLPGGDWRRR